MRISASNAPFSLAHTIAIPRTIALWTAFWWVLTKQTPPRISAPTASPSGRSKESDAAAKAAAFSLPQPLTATYKKVMITGETGRKTVD